MRFGWSRLHTIALVLIGAPAIAAQSLSAEPAEDKERRNAFISIYSYASVCSAAYTYIGSDGFKNKILDFESRTEYVFWNELATGAALAIRLPPEKLGMIKGADAFTHQRILGPEKMMADARLIAADCAEQKPKYQ